MSHNKLDFYHRNSHVENGLNTKRRAVLVREEACPARLFRRTFRRHHVHQRDPLPFERMCGLRYHQGNK